MSAEIELLTALSTQPFSACEAQWLQLLRGLYLPIAYVPAIQAVLEKGRWKSQPDPMAYVRKGSCGAPCVWAFSMPGATSAAKSWPLT